MHSERDAQSQIQHSAAIIEKRREYNLETRVLFIGYKKKRLIVFKDRFCLIFENLEIFQIHY
jgi:hypothetical protein